MKTFRNRGPVVAGAVLGVLLVAVPAGNPAGAQGLFDRVKGIFGASEADRTQGVASALTAEEISGALKDALRVGSERVVRTLGRKDGFNTSPDVHIPLPGTLKTVQSGLARVGASGMVDELELRLNRAAEAAVPKAKDLFVGAISEMSIEDARAILKGPDDSATQYFRAKMSPALAADMKPIVEDELASVGAIQAYDRMMDRYEALPFVPDASANLTDYVLDRTIDGVFLYLGREEAAIRKNPAKQTTALLRKVFGG